MFDRRDSDDITRSDRRVYREDISRSKETSTVHNQ